MMFAGRVNETACPSSRPASEKYALMCMHIKADAKEYKTKV
jgi:hypothetical protein